MQTTKQPRRRMPLILAGIVIGALALSACGSNGDENANDNADATTSTTGATTTTASGGETPTTAAGGSATTAPPEVPAPVTDLAAQINDAGLGCDAVEAPRAAEGAQGAAQCSLEEAPAYLYTFTDNDKRDEFIDNGGVIDCTFIFGAGISFDYVVTDTAIIRPEDNADAEALADALDGEVRTINCEPPDAGN